MRTGNAQFSSNSRTTSGEAPCERSIRSMNGRRLLRAMSAASVLDTRTDLTINFWRNDTTRRESQRVASGADRDRTDDILNAIQALSQLSYSPGTLLNYSPGPGLSTGVGRRREPARQSSA